MTFVSKTEILVAGCQDQMFVIDVVKGEITQQVRGESSELHQNTEEIGTNK